MRERVLVAASTEARRGEREGEGGELTVGE